MKRLLTRILFIGLLLFSLVAYLVTMTSWGLTRTFDYVATQLPGTLTVTQLDGALAGPFSLSGLHYRDATVDIQIDQWRADWQPLRLIHGLLRLKSIHAEGVRVELLAATEQQAATVIALPMAIEVRDMTLQQLQIIRANDTAPLVIDRITLQGRGEADRIELEQFTLAAYHAVVQTQGNLSLHKPYPLQLNLQWQYQAPGLATLSGKGTLHGDIDKLVVAQQLEGALQAALNAEISGLQTALAWQAQLTVQQLSLTQRQANAEALKISGNISGKGDLSKIELQGDLQGSDKQWGELNAHVSAHTKNAFANYHLTLDGNWTKTDQPPLALTLDAQGERKGMQLQKIQVRGMEGLVRANAKIHWLPQIDVTANVALSHFDPGRVWPDWRGQVDAELSMHATQPQGTTKLSVDIHSLGGTLRGYPLHGKANVQWQPGILNVDGLRVSMGKNTLALEGRVDQRWDMRWQLQAADVNALWLYLDGEVFTEGNLSGELHTPHLQATIEARELVYATEYIQQLSAKVDVGLLENDPLSIDLSATNVQTRAGDWQTATVHSSGTLAEHRLSWQVDGKQSALTQTVLGKYHAQHWQGVIEKWDMRYTPIGSWQLAAPVSLLLSSTDIQVPPVCLQQATAHLCLSANRQATVGKLELTGKAIPLALLKPWLPSHLELTGQTDLNAQANFTDNNLNTAQLELHTVKDNVILNFIEQDQRLLLGASQLQMDLNAQGLSVNLDMPLKDGGGINSRIQLPAWRPAQGFAQTQTLRGAVQINQIPAQTVARFMPEPGQVQGVLQAEVELFGSVGEPQLRGTASWQNGNIVLPSLGITMRDLNATVHSAQTNTVQFQITARSGDGEIHLDGQTQLQPEQGWPTQAHLFGNDVEVMNTPETLIQLSPDIHVELVGSNVNVKGEVLVPRARLRPRNLPQDSVAISHDVIVITDEKAPVKADRWKLHAQVRVKLGERVDIDGFGLSGRLSGTLLLIDEPEKLAIGQGEVSISEGIYRMRGQNLTIRRGRLLFANSLLDDPGVDVEAVREIDAVTAGVRVHGTLKKPELTVFAEPAMAETDALAYLVMGRPLSQASTAEGESIRDAATAMSLVGGDLLARDIGGRLGLDELRVETGKTAVETSLVVGKYLSPKLYVRYFSGIVESSNIVQFRYQLSKRVQIQSESGYRGAQSITSGDIFFTIEY
jgi:translocation and assembly module TamB